MKIRILLAAIVSGALLVVGASPALAATKHHRIGMRATATRAPLHSLKPGGKIAAPTPPNPQSPVTPLAEGYKCKVFVGYATANNPRSVTTFDSETHGWLFLDSVGNIGGVLVTTCQGQLPTSSVHAPGTFESQCFQPNFFPTGGPTIKGVSETVVFPDGQYVGTCESIKDPFS